MKVTDWSQFPNFKQSEMRCKQTGECEMDQDFMTRLQAVRTEYGRPMIVSSGYRSPRHTAERKKKVPGTHAQGKAVDITCIGEQAYEIVRIALLHGFTGIGISQKEGLERYVHLDTGARKAIWSY